MKQVEEKRSNVRLCQAFYYFFAKFNKFNNTRSSVRFYLSYDINIILKSHYIFWHENAKILLHNIHNIAIGVIKLLSL